jgi:hypothetical protein
MLWALGLMLTSNALGLTVGFDAPAPVTWLSGIAFGFGLCLWTTAPDG